MKREYWIDYIKLFACILVAIGHLLMGMVEAGILGSTAGYKWFIGTIYYFHVPLFFLCSGYLHQQMTEITTISSWKNNVLKKAIALGIPYFVFSFITWMLKNVFSGSVNSQTGGLMVTLLLRPSSPYWYLYTLFFIFLIMPTFTCRKYAVLGLAVATALKYVRNADYFTTDIYAITQTLEHLVWFVVGMCLSVFQVPERYKNEYKKRGGLLCAGLFLAMSLLDGKVFLNSVNENLLMGGLGCSAVFLLIVQWRPSERMGKILNQCVRYTMPIYLMHTIFAAGIRAVLMKLGIEHPMIHTAVGLLASFVGPVAAMWFLEKIKLEYLVYPGHRKKQNHA